MKLKHLPRQIIFDINDCRYSSIAGAATIGSQAMFKYVFYLHFACTGRLRFEPSPLAGLHWTCQTRRRAQPGRICPPNGAAILMKLCMQSPTFSCRAVEISLLLVQDTRCYMMVTRWHRTRGPESRSSERTTIHHTWTESHKPSLSIAMSV